MKYREPSDILNTIAAVVIGLLLLYVIADTGVEIYRGTFDYKRFWYMIVSPEYRQTEQILELQKQNEELRKINENISNLLNTNTAQ